MGADPFDPDYGLFKVDRHHEAIIVALDVEDDTLSADDAGRVIVFPGTGIQDNFADKARKLGINAYDFRNRGGA